MDKPFSTLPTWAVVLIAFSIAIVAGFLLTHLVKFNIIVREDGTGYLEPSFWHPMHKSDCARYRKELDKLDGTAKPNPTTTETK